MIVVKEVRMDIKELRERLKKISHNIYASDNDFADAVLSLIDLELRKAEKWDALTKKYPHFCKRFDPEIDGEVKDGN